MQYYRYDYDDFNYPFDENRIINPLYDMENSFMVFKSNEVIPDYSGIKEINEEEYNNYRNLILEKESEKYTEEEENYQPSESEMLNDYIVDLDFRVAMMKLGIGG